MVATAVGMQALGWRPFASTFAAFLSRAYDFVRMSAISRASYALCGSHAGISIGEDGPSQMALEDIASIRAIHGSTVLHPCDANQTAKLVVAMADLEGISYLRTLRPATPVLYGPDEEFPIGGSRDAARRRRRCARRRRDHRARGAQGRGDARRRRDRGARDRPLLDQADRRRHAPVDHVPDRHGRGPLGRGRPRRGGADARWPARSRARRSSSSRCLGCRTPASRPSCSPRRASTRTASPPPRASSSALASARRLLGQPEYENVEP